MSTVEESAMCEITCSPGYSTRPVLHRRQIRGPYLRLQIRLRGSVISVTQDGGHSRHRADTEVAQLMKTCISRTANSLLSTVVRTASFRSHAARLFQSMTSVVLQVGR